MGKLYQQSCQFVEHEPDTIWVEIGSDRWEGSTLFFAQEAAQRNIRFHTVDIVTDARRRIQHENITWHQSDGETWCREVLPTLGQKVGLVYLDNFDYNWDINQWSDMIRDQKKEYIERFGIEMTNQNCQLAHMRQLLLIEPYLSKQAIVVCDDTYTLNDCWVGKCGGIVLYLMSKGWQLSLAKDFGVILKRCNE